jgi:hypothetical protein
MIGENMSRTFRRKNYETTLGTSWARRGDKVNGHYTKACPTYGFETDTNGKHHLCYYDPEFRAMTDNEYNKAWRNIHTDKAVFCSPSKWFRQINEGHLRMLNKYELIKFSRDYEYEVMAHANLYLPYWN